MNQFILLLLIQLFLGINMCYAQKNTIFSEHIASLETKGINKLLPIVYLHGDTPLTISFDDLTHNNQLYAYRVEHCEADWTPSTNLFDSDYLEGFAANNVIENYSQSINTNVLYTHYTFQLPNEHCKFKISGNYRISVYPIDNIDHPVLSVCMMVAESEMSTEMKVTTNTDIDINHSHQQVEMKLSYKNHTVQQPTQQIKTVVLQNGRWDDARFNVRPLYTKSNGLEWIHCKDLIFNAGNEFRKFELLDVNHTTMGIDAMEWDGSLFNAYVRPDEPRFSYVYDEAANGAFYIRNSENDSDDTQSDYLKVHFCLHSPVQSHPVYLNAAWTLSQFAPQYEMKYNTDKQVYENTLLLKQGYYSYQYLTIQDGVAVPLTAEGNFFQTRNAYQALVYYRALGERTDRLMSYTQVYSR